MKTPMVWAWVAFLVVWSAFWAFAGGLGPVVVLLHWPVAWILLSGYVFHLRGGVIAAGVAAALLILHKYTGALDSWTVIGWQVLVYWIFGLYPFKFIQIREQRQNHYRTLVDYKKGELDSLRARFEAADRECRELEKRLRTAGRRQ